MTDDNRTLRFATEPDRSTVRRIVGIGVAVAGLLFLLVVAAALPALDRLVAGLSISPTALFVAAATLLIAVGLVRIAPTVESVLAQALDGPDAAVADAAAAGKLLIGFLAVAIAYRGFAATVEPLFSAFGIGGIYHLTFLLAGVAVLAALARRLYRCWAPVTDLVTDYLLEAVGPRTEPVQQAQ